MPGISQQRRLLLLPRLAPRASAYQAQDVLDRLPSQTGTPGGSETLTAVEADFEGQQVVAWTVSGQRFRSLVCLRHARDGEVVAASVVAVDGGVQGL